MVIHQRRIRLDHQLEEVLRMVPQDQKKISENLPFAIKDAAHLKLKSGMHIIYDLFHEEFGHFGPVMDVRQQVKEADYFVLKTSSQDVTLDQWISDALIAPSMKRHGYNEDRIHHTRECLDEIYKNSLLYASKVGKDDYYTRRNIPPPGEEQREINKKRKVYVEAFISSPISLLRVSDYGRGVDYDEMQDKSLPDNIKELPIEQMLALLEDHGRGIDLIKKRTGHTPFASGPLPFSTSIIIYEWDNMAIKENMQRAEERKAS